MATAVKKSAKINFYKFVPPMKVGGKADAKDAALQDGIGKNTQAINNIGATLNSLGKVLIEFRDAQVKMIEQIQSSAKDTFKPIYAQPTGGPDMGKLEGGEMPETEMPSWLESLFNIVKDFLILALAGPALEWLSDEKNREAIKNTIETILKVVEFVSNFIGDRVKGLIDNLHDLFFNKEQNWWEKLGSFFGAFVNFAGLFLAIRWLTNPMNIVKDFKSVLGLFVRNLKKSRSKLARRAKGLGAVAAVATLTTIVVTSMNDDGGGDDKNDDENKPGAAKGGAVPLRAGGGWINGPMSGYPVSLDGGKSTSFIGHGLEYVSRKSNGGFVIPFDTPATKNNSGLTERRMSEASRMGFDMGGMFDSMPEFARGGLLDFIASGEGGYNSMNQGTKGNRIVGSTHDSQSKVGKKLTDMTIEEILKRQKYLMNPRNPQEGNYGLFAVGRYQVIPGTMNSIVRTMRLQKNSKFDKAMQDKIGAGLIQHKRPYAWKYIKKQHNDRNGAMAELAREWASLPNPATGRSFYGGGNASSHSVQEVAAAIDSARNGGPLVTGTSLTPSSLGSGDGINLDQQPTGPGGMSQPFNLGEGIKDMVKNLMGAFGGKPDVATDGERASAKESGTASANARSAADVSNANQENKPKVSPPPLPPVTPASTPSSQTVTEATKTQTTARNDRRSANAERIRAIQAVQQAQSARVAALSRQSQEAVAKAQTAENNKQPTIAGGGNTRTASLIDKMQSGNSLLKT